MLQSNSFKNSGIKKKIFERERGEERRGVEREKRGVGGGGVHRYFLVNTIRICVI